ncbi:PAS domain S-box protein [Rhodocytophaga rosea]|uniref:histidine kinase n=1 Tax=Rhodocytophaga rosea TaxID=2704465 RepID=A0A6C0GPS9_9BACT|nr:PAS domain S-box protein [Rhodocytophaga rosea]QHT69844.1 PAS domain S-box protein [Rhodocytophaga rosea]
MPINLMIDQDEKNKRLEALRSRAEKRLKLVEGGDTEAAKEKKLNRLVHELQVHQVELEMQNEELQYSRVEIEKSRDQYADLYNFAPIPYLTLDTEGHIIQHNLMAAQLLGYERKHLQHKRLINFVAPEDSHTFYSFFKTIHDASARQIIQVELITKNGERRVVQLQAIPSRHTSAGSGKDSEILLTATDITDLKKAEAEIRNTERFKHIIEGIPGMYLFLAPDHIVMEASNDYLQMFHLERERVVGYTILELFTQTASHNGFTTALQQSLLQVTYHQKPHTTPVLRYDITLPDGNLEQRYWRVTHSPVLNKHNQVDYIIQQMMDVTREYLAQQEIESSRQRFEMLALASNDIVWEWNMITGLWWWNQNLESHFGYNRATLEPGMEAWTNRIHPEDKDRAITQLMDTVINGKTECRQEYRFRRINGTYAYVLDRAYALQEGGGKTIRMLGTMVDITEQKEAEFSLRKINERFRLLLDTIPQLAWITEPDGNAIFYNHKWNEYTGTDVHILKGWEWQQHVHPEDAARIYDVWETALHTGQTALLQGRWRRASTGQYRWHTGQIIPVHNENGQISNWVGSLIDIHDQKLVEEALRDNAELRETKRKLQTERDFSRSLIDNTIDGIFTFDHTPC